MFKKIGKYILFICSIAFFSGASFVLYHEYISYNERVKRYTKDVRENIENDDSYALSNTDIDVLENYREQRNILLGNVNFLKESAINYHPENFSYAHILSENISIQLEDTKFTQPYWNTLLTSFYTDISSEKDIPIKGYDAIMRIPETYINTDLEGIEDTQIIKKITTENYWKNQIIELDRSSQNLEKKWLQNKPFFYTFMTKSKYDKLCKNVIDDLIDIHDSITKTPNHKEFYKTYNVQDSIFHTFPSAKFVSSYKYSWPFSFWDRRFSEKNDEIVYKIIKEVKNHYEN